MYYVYVLKSLVHDWHYIGHAKEPKVRLRTHNSGKVRATKAHLPYRIIYTEEFRTRSEAHKREYFLKRGKGNFWLRDKLKQKGIW